MLFYPRLHLKTSFMLQGQTSAGLDKENKEITCPELISVDFPLSMWMCPPFLNLHYMCAIIVLVSEFQGVRLDLHLCPYLLGFLLLNLKCFENQQDFAG